MELVKALTDALKEALEVSDDPEALASTCFTVLHKAGFVDSDLTSSVHEYVETTLGKASSLPWEEAVRILHQTRRHIFDLQAVTDALEKHIYLTGEHGVREVEGVGPVRVMRGRDRTEWDFHSLAPLVVDKRLEENGGELTDPFLIVSWLLEAFNFNYARVTVVRDALGIPVDEYCASTPGKISVQTPSIATEKALRRSE